MAEEEITMEAVWLARTKGIPNSGYDLFRHEPLFNFDGDYKGNHGGYCNMGVLPFIRVSVEEFESRWPKLKIKQGEKMRIAMTKGKNLELL